MESAEVIALIALIISVPTAVWTLVYSNRQTASAARANALTEKAQREQAEPYVIADIRNRVPGSSLLVFVIENIGPSLARDVQLTIDPPLQTARGAEKDAVLNRAVTRKISSLPPKRSLSFVMDAGHRLFSESLPMVYTVKIDSIGPFGAVETLTYVIDIEMLRNSVLDRESIEWSTHVIAEQSKKRGKRLTRFPAHGTSAQVLCSRSLVLLACDADA